MNLYGKRYIHAGKKKVRVKARRIFSLILTFAVLFTTIDFTVLSTSAQENKGTITSVRPLADEIANQKLPLGADESDILFPDTLSVTIERTEMRRREIEDTGEENGTVEEEQNSEDSIPEEEQEESQETENGALPDDQDTEQSAGQQDTEQPAGQQPPSEAEQVQEKQPAPESVAPENDTEVIQEEQEQWEQQEQQELTEPVNEQTDEQQENVESENDQSALPAILWKEFTDTFRPMTVYAAGDEDDLPGADSSDPDVLYEYVEEIITTEEELPVTWKLNTDESTAAAFSSEEEDAVFVYTPQFDPDYTPDPSLALPTITVTIEEEAYPAQTFEGSAGDLYVHVEADEDTFPADTKMQLTAVSKEQAMEAAQEAIDEDPDREEEVVDALAVDITFTDADGEELQPLKSDGVHVRLQALRTVEGEAADIAHIENLTDPSQETVTTLLEDHEVDITANVRENANGDTTSANVVAEFDAEHFSVYAIIGTDDIPRWTFYYFHNGQMIMDPDNPTEPFSQIVKNGDVLVEPIEPQSKDHGDDREFLGWYYYDDPDTGGPLHGQKVSFGTFSMPDGATTRTVYVDAKFVDEFKAILYAEDSNGNRRLVDVLTSDNDEGTVSLAGITPNLADDEALDYWKDLDGDETFLPDDTLDISDRTIRLLAVVKPAVTIYFRSNESVAGLATDPASVPDTIKTNAGALSGADINALSPGPSRTGYTFNGWYYDAACTNPMGASDRFTEATTYLYASWTPTPVNYSIVVWVEELITEEQKRSGTGEYVFQVMVPMTKAAAGTTVTWGDDLETALLQNITRNDFDERWYVRKDEVTAEKNDGSLDFLISGSGTTIINVYYDLKVLESQFKFWNTYPFIINGIFPDGVPTNTSTTRKDTTQYYSIKAKIGQYIGDKYPSQVVMYCYYPHNRVERNERFVAWRKNANNQDNLEGHYLYYTKAFNTYNGIDVYDVAVYTPNKESISDTVYTKQEVYLDGVLAEDYTCYTWARKTARAPASIPEGYAIDTEHSMTVENDVPYGLYYLKDDDNNPEDIKAEFEALETETLTANVQRIERYYYITQTFTLTKYNGESSEEKGGIAYGAPLAGYLTTPDCPYADFENWEFDGWYEDEARLVWINPASAYMPGENKIVYAKWKRVTRKVTFYFSGADNEQTPVTVKVDHGSKLTSVPQAPERSGAEFVRWVIKDTGNPFDPVDTPITHDYEVEPQWLSFDSYIIRYTTRTDTTGWTEQENGKNVTYVIGAHAVVTGFTSQVSEEYFHGWDFKEQPEGTLLHEGDVFRISQNHVTETTENADGTHTYTVELTAQYANHLPDPVTLTYHTNYNGGTVKVCGADGTVLSPDATVMQTFEGSDKLDENQTYQTYAENPFSPVNGYHIVAWNTKADATGTEIALGQEIFIDSEDEETANHLYAVWAGDDTTTVTTRYLRRATATDTAGRITINGNSYVLLEAAHTERNVETYSKVTADTAHVIDGYSFDDTDPGNTWIDTTDHAQGVGVTSVPPYGATINVIYAPAKYKVYYSYTGLPTGASVTNPAPSTAGVDTVYNTTVSLTATPTVSGADGYVFIGWSVQEPDLTLSTVDATLARSFTMPSHDVHVIGSFLPESQIYYTIRHIGEDLSGTSYNVLLDEYTRNGQLDQNVTAVPQSFEGFTFNATQTKSNAQSMNAAWGTVYSDSAQSVTAPMKTGLVFTFYYTREAKYNVIYEFEGLVPSGAQAKLDAVNGKVSNHNIKYGATVTAEDLEQFAIPGYTFEGWQVVANSTLSLSGSGTFTMPARDVRLIGEYVPDTNTKYTVEHYLQPLDGNGQPIENIADWNVSPIETETLYGTTGQEAHSVTPNHYTGYTYQPLLSKYLADGKDASAVNLNKADGSGRAVKALIAADGTTVIRVYYLRNAYKVRYYYNGTVPEGATDLTGTSYNAGSDENAGKTYVYGQKVYVAADAKAEGYDFGNLNGSRWESGWGFSGGTSGSIVTSTDTGGTYFTMPARDVRIFGSFRAASVTYTVRHLGLNAAGTGWTVLDSYTRTGSAYSTVSAAAHTFSGYHHLGWDEATGTDNRSHGGINVGGTDYNCVNEGVLQPVAAGETTGKIKLSDGTLEDALTIYYVRDTHRVRYVLGGEEVPGAEDMLKTAAYNLDISDNTTNGRAYVYGTQVSVANPLSVTGYTFHGWEASGIQITDGKFSMPDDDVILYGYFTSGDEDTTYTVLHMGEQLDGSYAVIETYQRPGRTGDTVRAITREGASSLYANYVFDETTTSARGKTEGKVEANGTLKLVLYYKLKEYSVVYHYEGEALSHMSDFPALPATKTYRVGETVTVEPTPVKAGYTFGDGASRGWQARRLTVTNGAFTMPGRNVELYGSFTKVNTGYQVIHYLETLDGTGIPYQGKTYVIAEEYELEGTAGENTAPAHSHIFEGYTYQSAKSVTTAQIAADGSTVLSLYYDRNLYSVTYEYDNTAPSGLTAPQDNKGAGADGTGRGNYYPYGKSVTVLSDPVAQPGYEFLGWKPISLIMNEGGRSFVMPERNVTLRGSFRARSDTKYQVTHYQEVLPADLKADDAANEAAGYVKFGDKWYEVISGQSYTRTGTTGTEVSVAWKSFTGLNYVGADAWQMTYDASGNATGKALQDITPDTDTGALRGKMFLPLPGDGTLEFRVFYDRAKYKVNYAYDGTIPTTASGAQLVAPVPEKTEYLYGEAVTFIDEPISGTETQEGTTDAAQDTYENTYDFSGWHLRLLNTNAEGTGFTMPARDVTVLGTFMDESGSTWYTVEHYLQNAEGTDYDLERSYRLYTGYPGTATAVPQNFDGYTYDHNDTANTSYTVNAETKNETVTQAGSTLMVTVSAKDSHPTLRFYYNRNAHSVTYRYTGTLVSGLIVNDGTNNAQMPAVRADADDAATALTLPVTNVRYGTSVAVADNPKLAGYTFSGWTFLQNSTLSFGSDGTFTMPDRDVVLTGYFTPNTNTAYTVNYYLADASGNYPSSPTNTISPTGTTGTQVTVRSERATFDGYVYDYAAVANAAYGYTRVTGTGTETQTSSETGTAGTTAVSVDKADASLTDGYMVIAADGSAVMNLYYKRQTYTVTYEITDMDELTDAAKTALRSVSLTAGGVNLGTFDENGRITVTGIPYGQAVTIAGNPSLTGYTFVSPGWSISRFPDKHSGIFEMPAANVVIRGRFEPADVAYKVEYYRQQVEDGHPVTDGERKPVYVASPHETVRGKAKTGTLVTAEIKDYSDDHYVYYPDHAEDKIEGTVTADGGLTLKLFYNYESYVIRYQIVGNIPATSNEQRAGWTDDGPYFWNDTVFLDTEPEASGYEFNGWMSLNDMAQEINGSQKLNDLSITYKDNPGKDTLSLTNRAITVVGWFNALEIDEANYTVEFYKQDTPGGEFVKDASMTGQGHGTVGTKIAPYGDEGTTNPFTAPEITGYTYVDMADTVKYLPTLNRDESENVIRLYYTNNSLFTGTYQVDYYFETAAATTVGFEQLTAYPSVNGTAAGNTNIRVAEEAQTSATDIVIRYPDAPTGFHVGGSVDGDDTLMTGAGVQNVTYGMIESEGQKVELKLYYLRNRHKVIVDIGSGTPSETEHKYGEDVSYSDDPTPPSGKGPFLGWDITDGAGHPITLPEGSDPKHFTMPDSDVKFTAKYADADDYIYRIDVYVNEGNGYPVPESFTNSARTIVKTAKKSDVTAGTTEFAVSAEELADILKDYAGCYVHDVSGSYKDAESATVTTNNLSATSVNDASKVLQLKVHLVRFRLFVPDDSDPTGNTEKEWPDSYDIPGGPYEYHGDTTDGVPQVGGTVKLPDGSELLITGTEIATGYDTTLTIHTIDPHKAAETEYDRGHIIVEVRKNDVAGADDLGITISGMTLSLGMDEMTDTEYEKVKSGEDEIIWIEHTMLGENRNGKGGTITNWAANVNRPVGTTVGNWQADVALIDGVTGDYRGIVYFDLSLYKQMYNGTTHDDTHKDGDEIHLYHFGDTDGTGDTAWDNRTVSVSITVPSDIQNLPVASGYRREYAVFRSHDYGHEAGGSGVRAERLTDWTTATTITFSTGLFSTYALAYRDVEVPKTPSGGGGGGTSTPSTPTPGSGGGSTDTPTGTAGATAQNATAQQLNARTTGGLTAENARNAQTGDNFDTKRHVIIMCSAFVILLWQIYCIHRDGLLLESYSEEDRRYILHKKMTKHHGRPKSRILREDEDSE